MEQIIGVYEVNPPIEDNQFVVISAVSFGKIFDKVNNQSVLNLFKTHMPTSETYIFPSDGKEITSFSELGGSQRNIKSHKEVLENLGYVVKNPMC